jgi:hypothetical protein
MEPLADPYNDRQVKTVPPPPSRPLSQRMMYPDASKKALSYTFRQADCPELGCGEKAPC